MKYYRLGRGKWDEAPLTYATSWRFEQFPAFVQEKDHLRNQPNPEALMGYDNITLLTEEPLQTGARLAVTCSFEETGAPVLVLADRLETDENGRQRMGDYFELVLHRRGVNVWRMHRKEGKMCWYLAMSVEASFAVNEKHTFSVKVKPNRLLLQVDDTKITLHREDLPETFHLGFNSCEGICRFYDVTL